MKDRWTPNGEPTPCARRMYLLYILGLVLLLVGGGGWGGLSSAELSHSQKCGFSYIACHLTKKAD